MKFHKTNQSERGVYRYPVDVPDGKGGYVRTYNVVRPGENGVTEADIATLHRIDDNEVNNNIRNSKPKISETDKIAVRNWREKFVADFKAKYGYEPNPEDVAYFQEKAFPKNWNVSIDTSADDGIDDDKSRVCAESAYEPDYDTKANVNIAGTLVESDYKDPPIINDTAGVEYIVRRLTPKECAKLMGFSPDWCSDLGTENPTPEDIAYWWEIFNEYNRAIGKNTKPKSDNQIIKWLKNPHSDSAEYAMWGNGVVLMCVCFVLSGIVYFDALDSK